MKALPTLLVSTTLSLLAVSSLVAQVGGVTTPAPQVPGSTVAPGSQAERNSGDEPVSVPEKETTPAPRSSDPTMDLVPAQPGQISPEPTLTPDNPLPGTPVRPSAAEVAAAKKKSRTAIAEADLALRIRLREAKTKALTDPKIQEEWRKSIIVRTDLERRTALTNYYKLLLARITKLDPAVTAMATTQINLAIHRMDQTRVAPTEALTPEESKRQGFISAESFGFDQF